VDRGCRFRLVVREPDRSGGNRHNGQVRDFEQLPHADQRSTFSSLIGRRAVMLNRPS